MKAALPPGEPTPMDALVAYQPGAVVSRQLLAKPLGNVTAFAFDEGQGLSEHTTPFDALAHVVDGEADITIDGATHRVSAGNIILMPGGRSHALRAVKRFRMILIMIKA
jgi:quercetin dioxygenase-like cupin family protein